MIKVYQTGILPLGHFDVNDVDLASLQGGEVLVFDIADVDADERRAPDIYSDTTRSYLRLANANDAGPFFFANSDKNSGNYSTPGFENSSMLSTAAAFSQQYDSSSKVSIFSSDGFYSIGVSVVDDGYITENTTPNTPLYTNDYGKLTTFPSVTKAVVGYFIEYRKSQVVNNNLNRPFYTAGSFRNEDSIIVYKNKGDGYSEAEDANIHLSNLSNTAINTHLLPDSDNEYALGSPALRWSDGYFGPSSLHISSTITEATTPASWSLSLSQTGHLKFSESNATKFTVDSDGYARFATGLMFPDSTVMTTIDHAVKTVSSVGSTPNSAGAVIQGEVLTLEPASGEFPGVMIAADKLKLDTLQSGGLTTIIQQVSGEIPISFSPQLAPKAYQFCEVGMNASIEVNDVSLTAGQSATLILLADSSGPYTLAFDAGMRFVGAPTPISIAANKLATLSFVVWKNDLLGNHFIISSYSEEL